MQILLGDCLEILRDIPDKSVDLVVTDPPYKLETSGGGIYTKEDKRYIKELNSMKDGVSIEVLDELVRVMRKVNIYIWCNKEQIRDYLNYFKNCNMELLTWHKTNPVPACGNKYLSDTEYLLFFREKGVKVRGTYHTKRKFYVTQTNKKDKEKYNHPTVKPLDITENIILNSSQEGDTVLDCFMGSGTVGEACVKLNRNFIGIEKDPKHFTTAKNRIKEAVM